MAKRSPFAKAIAKQLSTAAGRAAALDSVAASDPAAARRVQAANARKHGITVGGRVRYTLRPQSGTVHSLDGMDAAYVDWDNGGRQLCLLEDLEAR